MNNRYQIQFIIMIGLVGLTLNLSTQTQGKVFSTSKYAGTYSFGENVEKGPVGQVAIYPESEACKLNFTIKNNLLTITTLDNCYECGFGANVIADNQYKRKDNAKPEYFVNGEGLKVFFVKTSPENYLK